MEIVLGRGRCASDPGRQPVPPEPLRVIGLAASWRVVRRYCVPGCRIFLRRLALCLNEICQCADLPALAIEVCGRKPQLVGTPQCWPLSIDD